MSALAPADHGPDHHDAARLLVQCEDRPGVVAAVAGFLEEHGANITELGQHSTSAEGGRFFQRTVFSLPGLAQAQDALERDFAAVADHLGLQWSLTRVDRLKRVGIMVSRHDHCLLDLLWRVRRGDTLIEPVLVVSNHPDLAEDVRALGVPFVHVPVTRAAKAEAEARQLELLRGLDLVVMARYMQILSADFLAGVGCPVINIHHSLLPAFMGADPHTQAKERGVKLIGATAHYATEDLDQGPIIEQEVVRVHHGLTVPEIRARGRNVERIVLARAVHWHCEDRVFRHGNTTVVL